MSVLSKLMFAPIQVKADIVKTQKGHTFVLASAVSLVMEYSSAWSWEMKPEQIVQVGQC